jgi:RNA polymerase sigma-70 factor (ECF subfamily)
MAAATQVSPIRGLDAEKRIRAPREFVEAQRQNIAGHREEAALVRTAKGGDGQAFDVLTERHQQKVLRVARRFTRVREDAEDIAQQSFQKAFVHLHKFQGKSSFSTWLTRIAINEALMSLRRGRGLREISISDLGGDEEIPLELDIPDSRIGPEGAVLQEERNRILTVAMNQLTPGTRKAIELRDLRELSIQEAARVMGLSAAALKGRVFQGRRKLQQVLKRKCSQTFKPLRPRRETKRPIAPCDSVD